MNNLPDRIQSSLAGDINRILDWNDLGAGSPITPEPGYHGYPKPTPGPGPKRKIVPNGLLLTEREEQKIREICGDSIVVRVFVDEHEDRLLVKHPEYADIWYALDSICPNCRTSILKEFHNGRRTRYDCGICGLDLTCFEPEQTIVEGEQ